MRLNYFGRPRDVEPLRELYLRHEQKHHDRRQAVTPFAGPIGCAPEAPQLPGLPAERGAQAVHHKQRGPALPRHEPKQPEAVLREGARADPPAVGSLPRCVLGRDREKAPAPAPDHSTVIKGADDLRRFGVDQARGVELLVRVVLVAPAVGELLPEPGARHLPA
jgi:hypothetical protein